MDWVIDQIRERMVARDWTQAGFASALGISQKHLSQVFNGHADASYKLLDAMLVLLEAELVVVDK